MLSKLTLPVATKVIAGLGVLLIVTGITLVATARWGWNKSVALASARQACDDRVAVLQAEAKAQGAQNALAYTRGFNDAAQQVDEDFAATLEDIAGEQRSVLGKYERLLSTIPPLDPNCGPGQQRVDAFNEGWQ